MDARKVKALLDTINATKEKLESIENKLRINNMKIGAKNAALDESNMLLVALPFLESLGWKIYEGDIILEGKILPDNLLAGQRRRRVDIGLLCWDKKNIECKYNALIELKKGNIIKSSRKQISNYMVWSKTKYGILIGKDGVELFCNRVGGKDKDGNPYQQYHCFILNWIDLERHHNILKLISKDFMLNGYTDSVVKELYDVKAWNAYFKEQIEQSEFNNDKAFAAGVKKRSWGFNNYTIKIRLQYVEQIISSKF
jgi:hypothetical protein